METMEWRTADKSAWGDGPWQDEPDKRQWQDEATGLPCLIVRNHGGALCGYVGVDTTHPLHGKNYSDRVAIPAGFYERPVDERTSFIALVCNAGKGDDGMVGIDLALDVHGGITFADGCAAATAKTDPSRYICHVPAPGEPDHVWWFGFDCAHHGDLAPGYAERMIFSHGGTYRDIQYVTAEVQRLAKQLAEWPR